MLGTRINSIAPVLTAFFKSAQFPRWSFFLAVITLMLLVLARFLYLLRLKKENIKEIEPGDHKNKFSLYFEKILKKPLFTVISLMLVLIIVASFTGIALASPKVISPKGPAFGVYGITDEKPLAIQFDRPVKSDIEADISPELPGRWEKTSLAYGFFADTLLFYPDRTPNPETRYTVSLKKIKSLGGKDEKEYLLSFNSPALPKVKEASLKDGTDGILPEQEIIVGLDETDEKTAKIDFVLSPESNLEVSKKGDREYRLKAKEGFKKSTAYVLSVIRTPIMVNYREKKTEELGEKETIHKIGFRTIEAPGVKDYGPKGSAVLTTEKGWIEFKQDMDQKETEKSISTSPGTSLGFSWSGPRKVVFTPAKPLEKNSKYTVNLGNGAKVADGSPFEGSFSYSFTTIGHVAVTGFAPGNKAANVSLDSPISVTFNQAVDHASAESKFSINPKVNGSFSWSGNRLTFRGGGLGYNTKYTVSIGAGVKSIYGLDSTQSASSSFSTRQQSVTLQVPSYSQQHMYSCMAAAARDALAYRKVYLSENQILSLIGYDTTPFSGTWGNQNAVWGDPYSGVVGNIDGRSGGVNWGYGAYWGPTAKAISKYRPAEAKTGWTVQGIAGEVAKGNPVLVWWVNGVWPAYEVWWKTPSGKQIRGVNSMHVQVVKGFTGTVDNPTSFIVNDSGYGYPSRTYDVKTFKAKWSWFGNSAVIVR